MEIWKYVDGFNNVYQVSNTGKVKSLDHIVTSKDNKSRLQKGRFLKSSINHKGYIRYSLSINGKRFNFSAHRLVAISFIPNPLNKTQVNHKNGIKTDNNVDNLEWVDNKENIIHAYKNGLIKCNLGEKHHMSKLTNKQVEDIRLKRCNGFTLKNLSKEYGISIVAIYNISKNITYKHLTKN